MLFSKADGSLIETVAPGCTRSDGSPLDDAALEQLGKLLGSTLKEGTVQKVVAVFFMEDEARRFLGSCKRFGVECRALVAGQEQVLSEGQRVTRTNDEPRGPLMPLLREESWPHINTTVHRRLLSFPQNAQVAGPFVTFGWDSPKSVMRVTPELAGDRSVADLEREALENLAKHPYELTEVKPGHVMLGAEYGAELVLLPKVLTEVQARVGAKLLAVGLAKEGGFFATDASDLHGVNALMTWTRKSFDEAKGRRISPLPLLAQDGKLIGFVSATQGDDVTAPKKPFWKFW